MTGSEGYPLEGGCACGEVRYRLTTAPLYVHCCHCRWCQRETGSAFVLNAMVEAGRVELLHGTPQVALTPSESGKGQEIARCPSCSVALWSNYAGAGDKIRFLRVGTLDDPDRLPPDIHIYTASKQPWFQLPQSALAFPDYYDREACWPPESLARRKAVLDG
ncbi:GFA family protein [Pelagibius sp. CAU 1746]|uniref:GFA family protein n=1 Tax=Pelagibius sp. CAU 1746 TaxID=3140370 RepID=UPI00325AF4DA